MTTERTEQSDVDLVSRARAGDRAAFGALAARYQTRALRLAVAICGSADDAADIAQEAFVKAHRSLHGLTDPTMARPWMMRIVANEAKNHLRSRDRRRRRDERFGAWVVAEPADPERSAIDSDEARGLARALGRLRSSDRQVLACRYFAGLSEAETAAVLELPLGTVKSRTVRALGRLREELDQS